MDAANEFLKDLWPRFNAAFTVEPKEPESAFSPLVPSLKAKLPDILCLKMERTVGNDNCVTYQGRTLQISAAAALVPLRAGQGDGPRVRARRHGRLPRDPPEAGALRCAGEAAEAGRSGMSPSAALLRLAPHASSDGGTPKRTMQVLRKPDILFAPDTAPLQEAAHSLHMLLNPQVRELHGTMARDRTNDETHMAGRFGRGTADFLDRLHRYAIGCVGAAPGHRGPAPRDGRLLGSRRGRIRGAIG